MADWISIILALIASLAGALLSNFLPRLARMKDKRLMVRSQDGRTEEVVVPAKSSQVDIERLILDAKEFEKHIGELIKAQVGISGKNFHVVSPKRSGPDFVIPELGLGFEVKTKITSGDKSISRYFDGDHTIDHIYLIVRDAPREDYTKSIRSFIEDGKISIIGAHDERLLVDEIYHAINQE